MTLQCGQVRLPQELTLKQFSERFLNEATKKLTNNKKKREQIKIQVQIVSWLLFA